MVVRVKMENEHLQVMVVLMIHLLEKVELMVVEEVPVVDGGTGRVVYLVMVVLLLAMEDH